uniref:DUF7507 domain-containing protein n=1 Tax=Pararhodonellum marinum TaxID=2755358 RepID=UPI00188E2A03
TDPNGDTVEGTDSITVTLEGIVEGGSIEVTKTADVSNYAEEGDEIVYTITVRNNGTVDLTNVTVTDPLTGLDTTIPTLAANSEQVFTETYIVTAADITNGSITNTASAEGTDPNGDTVEGTDSITVTLEGIVEGGSIEVTKTANVSNYAEEGDEIVYTITVRNNGTVDLTDVTVTDPLTGLDVTIATLPANSEQVFTETYIVTAADITNGSITNTARAEGVDPNGDTVEGTDSAIVTLEGLVIGASIEVTKVVDVDVYTEVGEEITYTITVRNNGTEVLTNVVVTDPLTGLSTTIDNLGPNEVRVFTEVYLITDLDITNLLVTNVAEAIAEDPNGEEVADSDTVTIILDGLVAGASIEVTKSADVTNYTEEGDEVTYTIVVRNNGTLPLTNVVVSDPLTGLDQTVDLLLPNTSVTFTETYVITAEDITSGFVTNIATASGEDPLGEAVSDEDSVTITLEGIVIGASLEVSKAADVETYGAVGDVITYTISVRNNGTVTLTDVIVTDPLTGLDVVIESLAPNTTVEFEEEYVITQADIENGTVTNIATASVDDLSESDTVTIELSNRLTIVDDEAVTNQNTAVDIDILANDSGTILPLDPSSVTIVEDPENGTVVVNEDGTVTYTPNENFSGTDTFTYQVCDTSTPDVICGTAEVTITVRPILVSLEKTADVTEGVVGDLITYTLTLTNNSEFDLEDVVITDELPEEFEFISSSLPIDGEYFWNIGALASGESVSIEVVVMAVAPGELVNTMVVNDGPFEDSTTSDPISVRPKSIDMSISKTSFEREIYEGDEFNYEIVVTNTGLDDATEVVITDQLPAGLQFVSTSFTASTPDITVSSNVVGNLVTWNVPFFPTGATLTIQLRVKAVGLGIIINEVEVQGEEEDANPSDNTDRDENRILEMFIPNVITPNADGLNDAFEIKGLGKFVRNQIVIFDRWGDHVFESDDYQNNWSADGLLQGTYFFVMRSTDVEGREHIFRGWIQVIKKD